jgi:hypothetical protein
MRFLLRFLPRYYKDLAELGMRMFSALDTEEERKAVLWHAMGMFDPNGPGGARVTVVEWTRLGGFLKILRGPDKKIKKS